jgi:hypothetical protein
MHFVIVNGIREVSPAIEKLPNGIKNVCIDYRSILRTSVCWGKHKKKYEAL